MENQEILREKEIKEALFWEKAIPSVTQKSITTNEYTGGKEYIEYTFPRSVTKKMFVEYSLQQRRGLLSWNKSISCLTGICQFSLDRSVKLWWKRTWQCFPEHWGTKIVKIEARPFVHHELVGDHIGTGGPYYVTEKQEEKRQWIVYEFLEGGIVKRTPTTEDFEGWEKLEQFFTAGKCENAGGASLRISSEFRYK